MDNNDEEYQEVATRTVIQTMYVSNAEGGIPDIVTGIGQNADHILSAIIRYQTGGDRLAKPPPRKTGDAHGTEVISRVMQLIVLGVTATQINSILSRENLIEPGQVVSAMCVHRLRSDPQVKEAARLWKNLTLLSGFAVRERQLELLNQMVAENAVRLYPDQYRHLYGGFLPPAPVTKVQDRLMIEKSVRETVKLIGEIINADTAPQVEAEPTEGVAGQAGDGRGRLMLGAKGSGEVNMGQMLEALRIVLGRVTPMPTERDKQDEDS